MTAVLNTAHVTSVHRYYELVDAGDVAGLVNMFSPDATYRRPGYAPMVGHDEMSAFYGGARVIREGRHTIDKVVESTNEVAVYGRFAGVLHDGSNVDLRFSDFFEFTDDGRFARRDTFFFAPLV
ncbi:Ketosteroid isomerase-related protein [Lentzea fradiae]|uniref:Ketosteroid isomerase-related protein n=1 Tax=Lentzea fradiae TaxID=200378 RepID=A0A1G7XIN6_9PSEU|nr:nuclear transport factor 2 family protein [Lentzea fradiae]SDG84115.1 Ketosteroid isomerase-related protein [Lentzea fradiae]